MFIADRTRPVVVCPAKRFVTMSRFLFIRLEPVRSLPAKLFAERTTQVAQTLIGGGEPQVAAREALLAGKVDIVILGVGLDRTGRRITEAVVIGAEAPHVKPPHIPLGVTVDDPFCHHLADAARAR